MFKRVVGLFVLVALLASPVLAEEKKAEASLDLFKVVSLDAGIDFSTHYMFRGNNIEDKGLIAQPHLELEFNIPQLQSENVSVTPFIGTWNSVHSDKSPGEPNAWYEADIFGGVNIDVDRVTVTLIFSSYTFPGEAEGDIGEFGLVLSFDDDGLGLPFALNPHVGYYVETNGEKSRYFEFGFTPSFSFETLGTTVTLDIPVIFGFSVDNYYTNSSGSEEVFGYFSVGAEFSVPIECLNNSVGGSWEFKAGVTYHYLHADSADITNNGENNVVTASVGIGFSF